MDDRAAWESGWSQRSGFRSAKRRRKRQVKKRTEEKEDPDNIWDAADEFWQDDDTDYFEDEGNPDDADDDVSWDLAD